MSGIISLKSVLAFVFSKGLNCAVFGRIWGVGGNFGNLCLLEFLGDVLTSFSKDILF